MYVVAGSWLIASVFIDLMTAMSSTIFATLGINSLTHRPHWPCWANLNIGAAQGNDFWPDVMPVMRCPPRTLSGSSEPLSSASLGL